MKSLIIKHLLHFAFGILIGGCIVTPGMDSGTMIILCGMYGALLANVNGLFKSKKQFIDGVIFLVPIALGAVTGIFALSRLLEYLITHYSLPVYSLFAGFMLGTVPFLVRMAYKRPAAEEKGVKFVWWHIIPSVLACAFIVTLAVLTPPDSAIKELTAVTGIMLFVCGVIAAAAMIFPGTSGAFLLVLLGYYNTVLNAVNELKLSMLAIFVVGAVIGLFGMARLIGFLLKRFKLVTHMAVAGFLIGSVASLFIFKSTYASATGTWGIVAAVVMFLIGIAATTFLTYLQKDKKAL